MPPLLQPRCTRLSSSSDLANCMPPLLQPRCTRLSSSSSSCHLYSVQFSNVSGCAKDVHKNPECDEWLGFVELGRAVSGSNDGE
ncbi:hypothetical protein E2C01_037788 [Portunus trituberculatus]|uniref:Uncharacterized protein n=1 Tax=Portunus trituberculatus TaxID=210409 RepID=A0A5B7FI45_PORTR|nr:hypothetical protein [Portunus trituberculatus]